MSIGLERLHHVGYVVASLDRALSGFRSSLGAVATTDKIHDPLQKVNVQFLKIAGDSVQIELVEPVGDDSPVQRFLSLGGGMNHLCYEVVSPSESLQAVKQCGGVILSGPKPAVAFRGRRIAWAITRERLLLEFLEMSELP